jgi:hypothetical protein
VKNTRDERSNRNLHNDNVIASLPDETILDATSKASSPLNPGADTRSSNLPSSETNHFRQILDVGCLENLYASCDGILAFIVFLTGTVGRRSISTNCTMEHLCYVDPYLHQTLRRLIRDHQNICDISLRL